MKTTKTVTDDLRAQHAQLDGHQIELRAERDEISYSALVDRDPKSIKRLAALNEEIAISNQTAASIEAALKEAARREQAADEASRIKVRQANASLALAAIGEAEEIAKQIDAAMGDLKQLTIAFEAKLAETRRLAAAGPQHAAVRALLARALRSGLQGLPIHEAVLAPGERHSVVELAGGWADQIRRSINAIIETAAKAA